MWLRSVRKGGNVRNLISFKRYPELLIDFKECVRKVVGQVNPILETLSPKPHAQ